MSIHAEAASIPVNPSQLFLDECRSRCVYAIECISQVESDQWVLDSAEGRERYLRGMAGDEYSREIAREDVLEAEYDLRSSLIDARQLARYCSGPDRYDNCDSPLYSTSYTSASRHTVRPHGGRRVLAWGMSAALAIGGAYAYNYLHSKEAEYAPSTAGSGAPGLPDAKDCLNGIFTGLGPNACTPLSPFPRPSREPRLPALMPSAAVDTSACLDTNKYDSAEEDATPTVFAGYINPAKPGDRDLSGMPENYQSALASAIERSAAKKLLAAANVPIYIWYTDDNENGAFVEYKNDAYDRLDLCIGNRDLDRVYETIGAMETVVLHESSHAVHAVVQQKAENGDARAQQLLNELNSQYKQGIQLSLEEFRRTYGPDVIQMLRGLQEQYSSLGRDEYALAVQQTIDQYETPHGLDSVATYSDEWGAPSYASVEDQLQINIIRLGIKGGYAGYTKGIDFTSLDEADDGLRLFYEKAFGHVNEDNLVKGIKMVSTHPFDDSYETFASTMASTQINPDGLVQQINSLSAQRRAVEVEKLETLLEIFQTFFPNVLPDLHLQRVVDKLKQAPAGVAMPVHPAQIEQFVAQGRRGWVSFPLTSLVAAA